MTTQPRPLFGFLGTYFYIGLLLGLLYWLVDAAVMTFIFNQGTFTDQVLTSDADEVYMRGFTWLIFGISGAVTNSLASARKSSIDKAKELLRIVEKADVEFYLCDAKTFKFLLVNSSTCNTTGYCREELYQMTPFDLSADMVIEDFTTIFQQLANDELVTATFETQIKPKNGNPFMVAVRLQKSTYRGKGAYAGYAIDISQRKADEREKQALQAQLLRSEKFQSLEKMAGGLAHNFNNLLTGAIGNAELALSCLAPNSPEQKYVNTIMALALKATELCSQLVKYTGTGEVVIEPLNLNAIVKASLPLLSLSIPRNISLSTQLADDLPAVTADENQLSQVLIILVANASEAIGTNHGKITITTTAVKCTRDFFQANLSGEHLANGSYICVDVSDTGPGMDDETIRQAFDPFYSTKFTGRGIGLSALLGIVRSHHGGIKIDSTPGMGTQFRVFLPLAKEAAKFPPQSAEETPLSSPDNEVSGMALVIDDEPVIRDLTATILESIGLKVITAENGRQGVDLFREHEQDIAVVILDVMMPVMNGDQAFDQMQSINSSVPIIFVSGFNDASVTELLADRPSAEFIQKPFRADNILDIVRNHIGQSAKNL